MSNSIAPGSSADVNVRVTALTTNPNVPAKYKTIILKKNLVNGVNTLTQAMMNQTNTKYVVKYNYVLGDDITVPANCVLEFDGGCINGNYTITGDNTGIIASLIQIFNVNVNFTGTWDIDKTYPEWFGLIGDGIADDSAALLKAASFCLQSKSLFYINAKSLINIPNSIEISGLRKIQCHGKIIAPNGIEFSVDANQTNNEWFFFWVLGTITMSGLKNSLIDICEATKLILFADDNISEKYSLAYNVFKMGIVTTLELTSSNNGWINENVFLGGRIRNLKVDGHYQCNNNLFIEPCLEGGSIIFNIGMHNNIVNARLEDIQEIKFSERTYNNTIEQSYFGYTFPFEFSTFSNNVFKDLSGNNFYKIAGTDKYKTYIKEISYNSLNYNISQIVPTADKKLQIPAWGGTFLTTNFIDISKVVLLSIETDSTFFRFTIECYDANKERITLMPNVCPVIGGTTPWDDTEKTYGITSNDQDVIQLGFTMHTIGAYEESGNTSNVRYVKINFMCGGSSPKIEYFNIILHTSVLHNLLTNPFEEDKLTANQLPTTTDVKDGVIAYNTDATKHLLGWFFNNGAWHPIGEYQ